MKDWLSEEYAKRSLVQQSAARKLTGLISLRGDESVLDLGCGPGDITATLAEMTTGTVVGADSSEAMIERARSAHPQIEFRLVAAEYLECDAEFDAVFCNSAFHWFADQKRTLDSIYRALRNPGRLAISCPATHHFAPFFEAVVLGVASRPEIAPTWKHWRYPWFSLPDVGAYRELFERHRFSTGRISIDYEAAELSVGEAYGIFSTGAAMGYTNPDYYDCDAPEEFVRTFKDAVREEMEKSATDGKVKVDFNRLYYIGDKR